MAQHTGLTRGLHSVEFTSYERGLRRKVQHAVDSTMETPPVASPDCRRACRATDRRQSFPLTPSCSRHGRIIPQRRWAGQTMRGKRASNANCGLMPSCMRGMASNGFRPMSTPAGNGSWPPACQLAPRLAWLPALAHQAVGWVSDQSRLNSPPTSPNPAANPRPRPASSRLAL